MSVEAVVYDIGNVLIEWQPERFYDAEIGQARREAMFGEIDLHGMNDRIDRGHPWIDEVRAAAERYPKWSAEIMMWHDRWLEMAQPVIPRSLRCLRALRQKGVPVFALSNFGVETFAFAETKYPFLTEFDRRYISGHLKTAKPDNEIYVRVQADCGVAPEGLLFADDRQENLDAAAARGWQTHLFEGPDGWAARLVRDGLLTDQEAA